MTKANKAGRVFSYARWSSDKQSAGDSEHRQLQDALEWCRRNGRVLDERRFTDRGVSGWKGAHRQSGKLAALLAIVEPGDVILVEDASRWSRERPLESLNALNDVVVNRGVRIELLKLGVSATPDNFYDLSVFLPLVLGTVIANKENEDRALKIRAAMATRRQKLAEGVLLFGRLPCWLEWSLPPKNPDRKPIIIPAKVALVRRVFDLCIAGKGGKAIAKAMAGEPAISTAKRAMWNNEFIVHLLRDKSVRGYHQPSGAKVYPTVLPENTYYAAQAKLDGRKKASAAVRASNGNLFPPGMFRCVKCGGSVTRQTWSGKDRRYIYLVCTEHLRGRRECSAAGVRYDWVEASFFDELVGGLAVRRALSGPVEPSRTSLIEAKLADVRKQADKIMGLIDRQDNPAQRLADRLTQLEAEEKGFIREVLVWSHEDQGV